MCVIQRWSAGAGMLPGAAPLFQFPQSVPCILARPKGLQKPTAKTSAAPHPHEACPRDGGPFAELHALGSQWLGTIQEDFKDLRAGRRGGTGQQAGLGGLAGFQWACSF